MKESNEMYPQRPSLQVEAGFEKVEAINLNESERQELKDFDAEIYDKYKEAKDTDIAKHVIYPEAFTTEEGRKLFSLVYLDTSVWQKAKQILKEQNLEANDKKRAYNALFDDFVKISKGEEDNYDNFNSFLRSKGYEGEDHQFASEPDTTVEGNENSIIKAFNSVDMRKIPKVIRAAISGYSSDQAKKRFKDAFKTKRGEVTQEDIPNRIGKVVSPAKLRDKIKDLREMKSWIKQERKKFSSEDDQSNLDEAKILLLSVLLSLNYYTKFITKNQIIGLLVA